MKPIQTKTEAIETIKGIRDIFLHQHKIALTSNDPLLEAISKSYLEKLQNEVAQLISGRSLRELELLIAACVAVEPLPIIPAIQHPLNNGHDLVAPLRKKPGPKPKPKN